MRPLLFFVGLLFSFLQHFSQSFTNGSVYNYSVGDTIVTAYQIISYSNPQSPPPLYTYRICIQKNYSVDQSTIYYTFKEATLTVDISSHTPPFPSIVTNTVTILTVGNLTASVINFSIANSNPCQTQIDTSYLDNCGRSVHDKYLKSNGTCFEPTSKNYKFIEGIGDFYSTFSGNNSFQSYKTYFVAAHKVGQNCGVVGFFPNGINETGKTVRMPVFPNPSIDTFAFDSPGKGTVAVYNSVGSLVYSTPMSAGKNVITLEKEPAGVYNMVCLIEGRLYTSKLLKE